MRAIGLRATPNCIKIIEDIASAWSSVFSAKIFFKIPGGTLRSAQLLLESLAAQYGTLIPSRCRNFRSVDRHFDLCTSQAIRNNISNSWGVWRYYDSDE